MHIFTIQDEEYITVTAPSMYYDTVNSMASSLEKIKALNWRN